MQQMRLWVWNTGLAQHTAEPVHADCLVKQPVSPVRGVSVVKANLFVGFDIDPAVIRKTATWKSDSVRPFAVDNREFQVAVERCGIY
jgi:Flp pilus assembly protein CpaB